MTKSEENYKVVSILDNQTLIINAGKVQNISIGQKFEIIGKGMEIIDPDTKESLGFIDNIKEIVTVTKLFDKMCECSCIQESPSILDIVNSGTNSIYNSQKYKKVLNVNQDDIYIEENQDKTIRVGDIAKLKIMLPSQTKKH